MNRKAIVNLALICSIAATTAETIYNLVKDQPAYAVRAGIVAGLLLAVFLFKD